MKSRKNKDKKLHFRDESIKQAGLKSEGFSFSEKQGPSDSEKRSRKGKRYSARDSEGSVKSSDEKKKRVYTEKTTKFFNKELRFLVLYSFLVFIVIETIFRQSFFSIYDFLLDRPVQFIVNYCTVLLIFSFTIIMKRKKFAYALLTFIMVTLSGVSTVLFNLRGMPLSPYDIFAIQEALQVSDKFINRGFRNLIIVALILVLTLLISLFILNKNRKRVIYRSSLVFFIVFLSMYAVIVPQLRSSKLLERVAWNAELSYKNNGFIYSFMDECISAIRKKPKGYDKEVIERIRNEVDKKAALDNRKIKEGKNRPNIIFVQLEAFTDPTRIKGCKFSEDPMPNMRRLMKNYTSGYMSVPVTGGGTARTEFEVLSGCNFAYLNHGEIPYYTFLSDKPSISLATELDKNGYYPIAIHNFYANFYNRDVGLKNIGFRKFIPLETMTDYSYTPLGWIKDNVLSRYIMDELKDNKNQRKFIFTVSTQGHSSYPTYKMNIDYPVKLEADKSISPSDYNQILYYANQIKEMDNFIGDLVSHINAMKEPSVLVMYGDHLPALDILRKNPDMMNLYSSLFVVANNFGYPKLTLPGDFAAYQLSTLALKTGGLPYGPMNMVHAYLSGDKDYQHKLELVQYDILFGKRYFLKDYEKPEKVDMQTGNKDLKITGVEYVNGNYFIKGEGINRFTKVTIGRKVAKSSYVDSKTLKLYDSYYTGSHDVYLERFDNDGNLILKSNTIKHTFRE